MKIAIFTDTYDPDINGVARTLKRFTDYLTEQKITYKIFAPKSHSNEYVSTHIHRFKSLSFFLYPECRLAFPNLFHIKSELESFAPDLIHVATPFNIGLSGAYFAKKLNIPLVGSYHTDFDKYLQFYSLEFLSKVLWKYMSWFHSPFQKIFVPSNETLSQLNRRGFTNLEIWSRGVDCRLFHPQYDKESVREHYGIKKKYLLTYVGRLAPEKDVKTLLAVAKSLPAEINEKVQWLIIGDGPLREEIQNDAPKNMLLTGYLKGEELAKVYSSSDLFVFPSPTETFGNVVLEALASGTPVIGANSGGVKNIIQEGKTGRLCEPGNIHEFTNAIVELLTNENLLKQMGTSGRNFALTQRWDVIFDNLLGSYIGVIRKIREKKYA
ncbi:glycosyltransferase family 1 protein [Bacillus sp. CECT 9360]|uniref:glycosyltransferase family 4 protein n=1 Tax=Bacillus sp. CECT 9360 TaxID=2845821 RepID=UPI001E3B1509|nr:glycosyltransferase family 1 protein [Bacillus sp. CECT 9360]CAH0347659.1 GDP-mannose-dependent alpha-mannosyltransferase [Bacillus sp. CECT 9360]